VNTIVDAFSGDYKTTIRVMNADGTSQKDLASFPRHTIYAHDSDADPLCWSADGTRVLFGVIDTDTSFHTYSMRSDGSDLTPITSSWMVSCGR